MHTHIMEGINLGRGKRSIKLIIEMLGNGKISIILQ